MWLLAEAPPRPVAARAAANVLRTAPAAAMARPVDREGGGHAVVEQREEGEEWYTREPSPREPEREEGTLDPVHRSAESGPRWTSASVHRRPAPVDQAHWEPVRAMWPHHSATRV